MEQANFISVVVEGTTDEIVFTRIFHYVGIDHYRVMGKNGKEDILKKLSNYNHAAQHSNWLVCVDLDNSAECAPEFVADKLPIPAENMIFRVAVRSIESWLLADHTRFAAYLRIADANIPRQPDTLLNPKVSLINLVRRSHRTQLREDIVPRDGSGAQVGPGYVSRIGEFAIDQWRPEIAAENSPSLRKCIDALLTLAENR